MPAKVYWPKGSYTSLKGVQLLLPALVDINTTTMVRPSNMGAPWEPGRALVVWFSQAKGADWPVLTPLTQDGTVYAGMLSRMAAVVFDVRPWLVVSWAPAKANASLHHDNLVGHLGPEAKVEWTLTTPQPTQVYWRKAQSGLTIINPHHLNAPRRVQTLVRDMTGIVMRTIRLPSMCRSLDPDTFQYWTALA